MTASRPRRSLLSRAPGPTLGRSAATRPHVPPAEASPPRRAAPPPEEDEILEALEAFEDFEEAQDPSEEDADAQTLRVGARRMDDIAPVDVQERAGPRRFAHDDRSDAMVMDDATDWAHRATFPIAIGFGPGIDEPTTRELTLGRLLEPLSDSDEPTERWRGAPIDRGPDPAPAALAPFTDKPTVALSDAVVRALAPPPPRAPAGPARRAPDQVAGAPASRTPRSKRAPRRRARSRRATPRQLAIAAGAVALVAFAAALVGAALGSLLWIAAPEVRVEVPPEMADETRAAEPASQEPAQDTLTASPAPDTEPVVEAVVEAVAPAPKPIQRRVAPTPTPEPVPLPEPMPVPVPVPVPAVAPPPPPPLDIEEADDDPAKRKRPGRKKGD